MLRRRLAASNRLHRMPRAMPAATFLRHCIMATKRVTIQDVARAARVHASTVSRALSIHARPLVTPALDNLVSSRTVWEEEARSPARKTKQAARRGTSMLMLVNAALPSPPQDDAEDDNVYMSSENEVVDIVSTSWDFSSSRSNEEPWR